MPIIFKATVFPPLRNVAGQFAKATEALRQQQRDSMAVLGQLWKEEILKEAPRGKTGKFREAHAYRVFDRGGRVELRTYAPQPLATWIIKGTRPHLIVARKAKALRFLWENGPRSNKRFTAYHFYVWVWHPGTKPNNYLERAHRTWMPFAREELSRMGRKFVTELKI